MLVITRENNRIECEVNIGCNHSHKVAQVVVCSVLVAVVIQTFCQCIDLCLLRLIEHNRD